MKLSPSPSYARRTMRADDSLGRAMEAAFTLLAFFGIGFALDAWLDTKPVFMIVCSLLAAIGMFFAWKARYTAQMEELEEQRRHDRNGARYEGARASAMSPSASDEAPAEERLGAAQAVHGVAGERNDGPRGRGTQ